MAADMSRSSLRLALPALIVLLGVGGWLATRETIRRDRDAAAGRRAQVQSVRLRGVLGRASAYVAGLGTVLAGEPTADQRRFARVAGGTAGSVGLVDALWVERVADSERARYHRRLGAPITRLTAAGRAEPAPRAASYLPATFTSGTRAELRRGVDVSGWPGLGAAVRNRATVFAVGASTPGSLGGEPGFYLLQTATFGRGPGSRGVLAVFAPRGWLSVSLADDPSRVALSVDARRFEGGLDSAPAAGASFAALGRRWRVDVGRDPPSGLQSLLPWTALGWPVAAALVMWLVGNGIMRRRRAERDFERIFNLSLDMLCIAGLDGYLKRVNPAFERTLGYSSQQLLSRPFVEFAHPADRGRIVDAMGELARGREIMELEIRYLRPEDAEQTERWLQWSIRPVPGADLVYAVARDVTDRRRGEEELRRAQRKVEASRDALRLLAEEQAALRRVATLVARAASPGALFSAVTAEASRLLDGHATALVRYEAGGAATVVATYGGERETIDGDDRGVSAEAAIVVEGRRWGALSAWTREESLPLNTEVRLAQFAALVATAIANAESRAQLTASRARVVATADEARRRIQRDLHDGAQQRLVHTVIVLKLAKRELGDAGGPASALVEEALQHAEHATAELRELVRGILPAALSTGGLQSGIRALVEHVAVPVTVDVPAERLPAAVEATAYFIVAEALTNVVKHANAVSARVSAVIADGALAVEVRDDGAGGARLDGSSGLLGLHDRAAALNGELRVESPAGGGTAIRARLPLGDR
jgi:PAS domain S-box-containing protein